MNTLLLFVTAAATSIAAVATSIAAYVAWTKFVTRINVNIRQRDNGDYCLGLYLEQHSGLPARNVVVRVWVNGAELPPLRWPSMKTGQSITIGLLGQ